MEDPWPSAPWLLPFLCTFDVCLFTTGSDCPLVIAGVDFLSKQGDDVRDPGWDLANFEICWKAAAAHPTFFQLISKCVLLSLWNWTVSLTTTFDVETSLNLRCIISILSTYDTRRTFLTRHVTSCVPGSSCSADKSIGDIVTHWLSHWDTTTEWP